MCVKKRKTWSLDPLKEDILFCSLQMNKNEKVWRDIKEKLSQNVDFQLSQTIGLEDETL